MNNADKPAYPQELPNVEVSPNEAYEMIDNRKGLTKRERFCLENKVPRTGDQDLDDIIRRSLKQDAAMAAMQGFNAASPYGSAETTAKDAVKYADALLKQLEE